MRLKIIAFYLEFINDFLTVERFAEYHDLKKEDCETLLIIGKKYYKEDSE